MTPGTVKRLPIVELEIEGKGQLYFADKRLGEYRHIRTMHTIHEGDLSGTMDEIIHRYRVLRIKKQKKKGSNG